MYEDYKISNTRWYLEKQKHSCRKYIYSYIYAKGSEQIITDINSGEIQQTLKIKNEGLSNNLQILEKLKYLIFKEYDTGMYTIHLTNS